ncbi:acyltransferase family protein [Microbacterium sp. NPDC055683]
MAERIVARGEWMDVAKGAAIVFVVVFHAFLYVEGAGVKGMPSLLKVPLELFPIPAFFVLAGMTQHRTPTYAFRDLLRRRVLPLVYLYVLWSIIRWVFYVVVPGIDGGLGDLSAESPLTLALLLVWPSSSYWFLWALALFTLVGWLLRAVPPVVQLTAAGALAALQGAGIVDPGNVGWDRVAGMLFLYLVGLHFSGRIASAVAASGWRQLAASGAVVVLVVAALVLLRARAVPGVVLIGQLAAVAFGLVLARAIAPWRGSAPLADWGRRSLTIYLVHLFPIVALAAVLSASGWRPPRAAGAVLQVVLAAVALAASLWIIRATSRVRWLYVPPRPLSDALRPRGARRTGARAATPRHEPPAEGGTA